MAFLDFEDISDFCCKKKWTERNEICAFDLRFESLQVSGIDISPIYIYIYLNAKTGESKMIIYQRNSNYNANKHV
jgi:hypothetical protein